MKELYALEKYEEIINMCNEKDELNIYELWYLGNSYYKLKKYDKVIETYKRYKIFKDLNSFSISWYKENQ